MESESTWIFRSSFLRKIVNFSHPSWKGLSKELLHDLLGSSHQPVSLLKETRNGSIYWFGLDMNSGWRTRWIEGSHKGFGRPPIFPTPMVLDMTHNTTKWRFSRRCLIWLTSPTIWGSVYLDMTHQETRQVLTKNKEFQLRKFKTKSIIISWLLGLIYRITSCRDPNKKVLKTRHKRPKRKTWLNKVFDWNLECLLI